MKSYAASLVAGMIAATLCCPACAQTVRNYVTSEQRAEGVKRNLKPMYFLQDRAAPHASLLQRMTDLHPGSNHRCHPDGSVDWARGYGVAAIGGPPVTSETLFATESMSKPITALAVLKLYEQRRIDLDGNVNDYLKRWKLPASQLSGPKRLEVKQSAALQTWSKERQITKCSFGIASATGYHDRAV